MSNIVYHLVGYSRRIGERVVDEHEIPLALKPWAMRLAHVATDTPEATMRYPLDNRAARNLAEEVGIAADTASNQYFLEVFSVGYLAMHWLDRLIADLNIVLIVVALFLAVLDTTVFATLALSREILDRPGIGNNTPVAHAAPPVPEFSPRAGEVKPEKAAKE